MPDRRYVRRLSVEERAMIRVLGAVPITPGTGAWRFVREMQRLAREPDPMIVMWQAERLRALVWERRKKLPPLAERLAHTPIGSFRPVPIPPPREAPAYGYDD